MSLAMYQQFASLPHIERFINLLITVHRTCYEKIISEYRVITSTIELIDGYIECHNDVEILHNKDTLQTFRDWIGATVAQNIQNGRVFKILKEGHENMD